MQRIIITRNYVGADRPKSLEIWEGIARAQLPKSEFSWILVSSEGRNGLKFEATFQEVNAAVAPAPDFAAAFDLEREKTDDLQNQLAALRKERTTLREQLTAVNANLTRLAKAADAKTDHIRYIEAENARLGRLLNEIAKASVSRSGAATYPEHIAHLERCRLTSMERQKTMDTWTTDWKALRAAMTSRAKGAPMLEHVKFLEDQYAVFRRRSGQTVANMFSAQPQNLDVQAGVKPINAGDRKSNIIDKLVVDVSMDVDASQVKGPVYRMVRDQILEHVLAACGDSTSSYVFNMVDRIRASTAKEDSKT